MINLTDRPVIRCDDPTLLSTQIRSALDFADAMVDEQFTRTTSLRVFAREGFKRFFGVGNANGVGLDENFVQLLFDLVQLDSRCTGAGTILRGLERYVQRNTASASRLNVVKRGARIALVELWRSRNILLPTTFTPGPFFDRGLFRHELLEWILAVASHSVDPVPGRAAAKRRLIAVGENANMPAADARRLYAYGPRVLWTTDWQTPEDVSLVELSTLHRAAVLYRTGGHSYTIAGTRFPWTLLLTYLQRSFPDRVGFDTGDLQRYATWALSSSCNQDGFAAFVPKSERSEPKKTPVSASTPRLPASQRYEEEVRAQVTNAQTHEALVLVFRRLASSRPLSTRWRDGSVPSYPGREHVDVASLAESWLVTFRAYLSYRENIEGYRESGNLVSALTLLADYLFFYLPWWKDLNPSADVPLPLAPRGLSRYLFVQRHERNARETHLPKTLLELIGERRPSKHSAYSAIQQLARYFKFVATHYADDETIAGASFKSPLDHEFDAPRLQRKHKTTKEVIPKNLYGHLLFYAYAVEEFGNYLLRRALDGEMEELRPHLNRHWMLDTQALGYVPIVRYRGRQFAVKTVPNSFPLSSRGLARGVAGPEETTCDIPHLTTLRLLIASLETGLRCQSIQWLDRFTWDSLNGNADPSAYTYALLVNTDKTKTQPWVTSIVYRVRDLLLRESKYQEMFADAGAQEPVTYEGSDTAPFDPIHPLFRSAGAQPVSDSRYYEAWKRLLGGFEQFYREVSGERHVQICHTGPQRTPDGAPVIKQQENGALFCALATTTTFTPHSCRATFATNRRGVLELGDVADLLGHENIVTTAHYTKPSTEDIRDRLQAADKDIVKDYEMFDSGGEGGYVRADKPDSALVTAFVKDRAEAIRTFGFIPSVALWSAEGDMATYDGLELLKSGPMSRIRFRETHVCPVGEECPTEIVTLSGGMRRCGSCPLAMKSCDHLPAIAAKQHQLLERIQFLHGKRTQMERAGEPAAAVDAVWDEMELDVNELLGWKFSEEVLSSLYASTSDQGRQPDVLHANSPEIVRRHLERITRKCSQSEFVLQRLAESNAYPSMTSEKVQVMASALRRRLMAGQARDEFGTAQHDDIKSVAKMLSVMMRVEKIDMHELAKRLDEPVSATRPLLLRDSDHE